MIVCVRRFFIGGLAFAMVLASSASATPNGARFVDPSFTVLTTRPSYSILFEQQALAHSAVWVSHVSHRTVFHLRRWGASLRRPPQAVAQRGLRWAHYQLNKSHLVLMLLYQLVMNGRVPVASGDINETFLAFKHPEKEKTFYKGCASVIRETLQEGPLYLITGDSMEEVKTKFLPDMEKQENIHLAREEFARLHVLALSGQDRYHFQTQTKAWEGINLFPGITENELVQVLELIDEIKKEYNLKETFQDFGEPLVELRPALKGVFVAFKAAGQVSPEKRRHFRKRYDPLLLRIVQTLNPRLQARGLSHLESSKAGSTTIDIRTVNKGKALLKIKQEELAPNEYLVYVGDNLSKDAGDEKAMAAAAIGIHVGPLVEQTRALKEEVRMNGGLLILSAYDASEGATAAYLRLVNRVRSLARRWPFLTKRSGMFRQNPAEPVPSSQRGSHPLRSAA